MKKKPKEVHPKRHAYAQGNGMGWASWCLTLGLGLLGVWQFHNVEFLSHFDLVPAARGDNRLVTALLEYSYHALRGEGSFRSPAFYYPTQGTLGYADVFLSYLIPYGVLRNLGLDIFTCYQFCGLLFSILNFVCGFLLLYRGLKQGVAASALGAFFFAFNAPKFNQICHPQLQCLFLLPLAVWSAVEWAKKEKRISQRESFAFLSAAALLTDLQLYSGFYLGWFFLFWAGLFLAISLCLSETRKYLTEIGKRNGPALMGAAFVFFLGLGPFLWIYLPVIQGLGGKDYSEVQMMIPDPWSFLWMGPRHSWWGGIWDWSAAIRNYPVESEVRDGFGFAVLTAWVFMVVAAARFLRTRKNQSVYYPFAAVTVLSTTLFALLGMKYAGDISPWWLIYKIVPGGGSVRAVSRYVILLALPLSIALALGFQTLVARIKDIPNQAHRWIALGLLFFWSGAMVFEQAGFPPYPAFSKSQDLNRLEYLSEKLSSQCRAFFVDVAPGIPYDATNIQIDAMLVSAVRGIPTLNGYSGANPLEWNLYRVRSPRYHEYVQDWVSRNQIGGPVCGLLIDR